LHVIDLFRLMVDELLAKIPNKLGARLAAVVFPDVEDGVAHVDGALVVRYHASHEVHVCVALKGNRHRIMHPFVLVHKALRRQAA